MPDPTTPTQPPSPERTPSPDVHETHTTRDTYSTGTPPDLSGQIEKNANLIERHGGTIILAAIGIVMIGLAIYVAMSHTTTLQAESAARIAADASVAAQKAVEDKADRDARRESDKKAAEKEMLVREREVKALEDSATSLGAIKGLTEAFQTTNIMVQGTMNALKETQQQQCDASKEASKDAGIAARGMAEQKPLLQGILDSGKRRTEVMEQLLKSQEATHKALIQTQKESSEERNKFWRDAQKRDDDQRALELEMKGNQVEIMKSTTEQTKNLRAIFEFMTTRHPKIMPPNGTPATEKPKPKPTPAEPKPAGK
jgi:hypothetical protein